MTYPRQQAPLLAPVHTPWGIFQKGHIVTIIGAGDDGIVVCLDSHDLPDPVFEHIATIPVHKLFEWPEGLEHGTSQAYSRHRTQYEPACAVCKEGHSRRVRADRIRTGSQAGMKVPRDFLAALLDTASIDTLERADELWGRETVDAIREAS